MRTAYKVRAYPSTEQAAILARTFGCVRVVWNRTLAARCAVYAAEKRSISYGQASAALTGWKRLPELVWLNEVSAVPLQQALRHQQAAFVGFFAKRARYPRFKSRNGRQAAEYTRSGFRIRDGQLWLAKTSEPLPVAWSCPDVDLDTVNPTSVTVSREPDGRYFVSFAAQVLDSPVLPSTGRSVGVDVGVKTFAVLSVGERAAHPRHMARHEQRLKRYQRRLARP